TIIPVCCRGQAQAGEDRSFVAAINSTSEASCNQLHREVIAAEDRYPVSLRPFAIGLVGRLEGDLATFLAALTDPLLNSVLAGEVILGGCQDCSRGIES